MKTNNRTKMNIVRLVAMLLVMVGVLTALPAGAFAAWKYKWLVRDAAVDSPVTGTAGTSSVQLKYFADGVYAEPAGDVTYNYYQYDPTASANYYIAQSNSANVVLESGSTSNALSTTYVEQLTSRAVTLGTATLTTQPGEQTSAAYCTCGGLNTCAAHGITPNVTFTYSGYSMPEYTFGDFTGTNLFTDLAPSYTVNAYTIRSSSSSGEIVNASDTFVVELENGMDLIVTVNYVITITATGSGSTASGTCGIKHYYVGSTCTTAHYKYKATSAISVSATYTAYIRETTAEYPAVWNKGLTQIKATDDTDGIMYTIEGLSSNDVVTLPSYETLKGLIPTVVPSTKEGDSRNLYDTLLYPIGYYTDVDLANNSRGTKVSFPLTELPAGTTTVWVEWGVKNPNTEGKTDLNLSIGSATSGTINVYAKDQAASGYNTIKTDIAYLSGSNSFGLYSNVASGVTLNLCMNDTGKTNINASPNDSEGVTEENLKGYGGLTDGTPYIDNNDLNYTIVLQSDIVVNGSLYVGGHTGCDAANSANQPHGYILGDYVALDLNGHTLTVNGIFHSYGYVYDSVGTGKIRVGTSGTLYTQLLIYGMSGLPHTLKSYDDGYCPFEDYNMPYIRTTIELESEWVDTTLKAATMYGYTMLYVSDDVGIFNNYMKLFGAPDSSAQPLFSTTPKGTKAITTVESIQMESLSTIAKYCTDIKNVFTFEDMDVNLVTPNLAFTVKSIVSVTMEMKRVLFPISTMVDVTFHNSDMTLGQQVIVMPGSTLTFDENSTLKLVCNGMQSFEEKRVSLLGYDVYAYSAVDKYVTGGIYAPSYSLRETTAQKSFLGLKFGLAFGTYCADYWKYFGPANVNIYGSVIFTEGNAGDYVLSGNVNIHSFKLYNATNGTTSNAYLWNQKTVTSDVLSNVKLCTYGGFSALSHCSTGGSTNQHTAKISHHYIEPLISNGVAYVYDGSTYTTALVGTYDVSNGVFTANSGATYVILPGVTIPAYQVGGLITYAPTVVAATVTSEIATVDGTQYVYYAGAYNPITSTVDTSAITTSTTCTIDGLLFISSGTGTDYTKTLKWNGSMWVVS
ncbi:MAG: hypothetical protein IJW29_08560 [Clostridia bacterium]|nr:hypothetical protein [Clostridia bacterium]